MSRRQSSDRLPTKANPLCRLGIAENQSVLVINMGKRLVIDMCRENNLPRKDEAVIFYLYV